MKTKRVSVTPSWLLASPEPVFGDNAGYFSLSPAPGWSLPASPGGSASPLCRGWAVGRARASQTSPGGSGRRVQGGTAGLEAGSRSLRLRVGLLGASDARSKGSTGASRSLQVSAETPQNAFTERFYHLWSRRQQGEGQDPALRADLSPPWPRCSFLSHSGEELGAVTVSCHTSTNRGFWQSKAESPF